MIAKVGFGVEQYPSLPLPSGPLSVRHAPHAGPRTDQLGLSRDPSWRPKPNKRPLG
jgi:hypothetical protein